MDERLLAQALVKQHLGRVLAVGQLLVVDWRGMPVVARITATNTLDAAAQEVRGQQYSDRLSDLHCQQPVAARIAAADTLDAAAQEVKTFTAAIVDRLSCVHRQLQAAGCQPPKSARRISRSWEVMVGSKG